ncbi:MAG: hypothetical protein JWP94_3746 [Mucilaginibacter sp.]|nr:hypothetical protein [Mucilaginibacter sp.]
MKKGVMVSPVEPRRAGLTDVHRRNINVHVSKVAVHNVKGLCPLWFDGAHHDTSSLFGKQKHTIGSKAGATRLPRYRSQ